MGNNKMDKRSLRQYPEENEYLVAIKEDLCEWLEKLYPSVKINTSNFFQKLETGSLLLNHANTILKCQGKRMLYFKKNAEPGSWFARDNIHNFIIFCRSLGIKECIMFETEDLVGRKNEKHVIFTLLDVARQGANIGILAPLIVQYEREIEEEINLDSCSDNYPAPIGPLPQIRVNNHKNLDEMVLDLIDQCQCQKQFFAQKISDGKYQVGESRNTIFIRVKLKFISRNDFAKIVLLSKRTIFQRKKNYYVSKCQN